MSMNEILQRTDLGASWLGSVCAAGTSVNCVLRPPGTSSCCWPCPPAGCTAQHTHQRTTTSKMSMACSQNESISHYDL